MNEAYSFAERKAHGKDGEKWMDAMLAFDFIITPVTLEEEKRRGIDRRLRDKTSGYEFTAEYKRDSRSVQSGNYFIEIVSHRGDAAFGWAITTKADAILIGVPERQTITFLIPPLLKWYVPYWLAKYQIKEVASDGLTGERWSAYGIPVPISVVEASACFAGKKRYGIGVHD